MSISYMLDANNFEKCPRYVNQEKNLFEYNLFVIARIKI